LTENGKKVRWKSKAWAWVTLLLVLVVLGLILLKNSIDAEKQNEAFTRSMAQNPALKRPQSQLVTIVNTAATVNAASYAWYAFVVPSGANTIAVNGHFAATGGQGNDIECYVIDEDGLANLKNGHPATTYFNSGKLTQAKISAVLSTPGTYYIVLDNRFSLITPKAVQINATLSYMQ